MRILIIGGGTNLVVPDSGFDGLVIKIEMQGLQFIPHGHQVKVVAAAGENWDAMVAESINHSLFGLECLSGIPGLVGASPIQNIGAYGQEVSESIQSVECLDRRSLERRIFNVKECKLNYRHSIFKEQHKERFVITQVNYLLSRTKVSNIAYKELKHLLQESQKIASTQESQKQYLQRVRKGVLRLRENKGMLITSDEKKANFHSAGSFFMNPILDPSQYKKLQDQCHKQGILQPIPFFTIGENQIKVPAAWLIEKAGFQRGLRRGGVGISPKHALALINYNGTTDELLSLAKEIHDAIEKLFEISIQKEAVVIENKS